MLKIKLQLFITNCLHSIVNCSTQNELMKLFIPLETKRGKIIKHFKSIIINKFVPLLARKVKVG